MRFLALLLLLPLAWVAPATQADEFEIHINAGGSQITLPDGTTFLTDGPYSPEQGYGYEGAGDSCNTWHTIGGCIDKRLYQKMRHAPDVYRVDVPNGSYAVTLHLCDIWSHAAGQRWMGWKINDVIVLNHVDIYELVLGDYAIDWRFHVQVTDGQIRIEHFHTAGAMLHGVSVLSRDPDSEAPATPLLTEILGGFEQVIINWEDGGEEDLAGYEISRQPAFGDRENPRFGEEPNLVSRYVDNDVIPGLTYQYWISAVDIFGNTSVPVGPLQATPLPHSASPLPVCRIDIDPDSLAALNQDPSQDIYYSCTVTLDDSTYDAGLRYRGHAIRKVLKKSHKIKLDGDLLYQDRRKLNCNSEMCDPSLMRESLSMDLLRDAGVPAPRTWWRAIVLNDEYMGAYCDVEQVDEHFLTWHGLDENANIYKCHDRLVILGDSLDYLEKYEKETNEDGSWDDLIGFIEDLNLTPDEEFYEVFIDCLDFNEYLDYYTGLMLINDGDATFKNFFLYHDLDDDWWMIIPWDKDLTWGVRWLFFEGIYWTSALLQGHSSGGNMLTHRVFNEPLFKNIYASRIYEFLTERFPLDDVYARIDAAHALTEQNGVVDFRKWYWEDNTRLRDGDLEIREFAAGRYEHMLSQLTTLISPQELYINEFMAANSMTIADDHGEFDDWIEIHNPGPDPVFMGDYFLTDALREPIQWAFPDTTLAPGGFLLVWADDDGWQGPLHANFKLDRNGELIGLHKKEDGAGPEIGPDDIDPIDLVYFGPQVNDIARARMYDADLRWVYPDSASPGTTNGDGQGIADPDLPQGGFGPLRVLACPNPFQESIALTLRGSRAGGTIEIFDVSGRLCRRLATPVAAAGAQWIWDGRTDGGRQASPGAYWARLRTSSGGRTGATRLLLIR